MNEVAEKPMRAQVDSLQAEMAKLPQVELHTEHFFADEMYCRLVRRKKDVLIVGKVHKKEHFYMVVHGSVLVTTDDGVREIKAPAVVVSKPGTKRAVLALEDSVCLTVHRTDKTDLDEIEAELIEPDETALFDARNIQKVLNIEGEELCLGQQ